MEEELVITEEEASVLSPEQARKEALNLLSSLSEKERGQIEELGGVFPEWIDAIKEGGGVNLQKLGPYAVDGLKDRVDPKHIPPEIATSFSKGVYKLLATEKGRKITQGGVPQEFWWGRLSHSEQEGWLGIGGVDGIYSFGINFNGEGEESRDLSPACAVGQILVEMYETYKQEELEIAVQMRGVSPKDYLDPKHLDQWMEAISEAELPGDLGVYIGEDGELRHRQLASDQQYVRFQFAEGQYVDLNFGVAKRLSEEQLRTFLLQGDKSFLTQDEGKKLLEEVSLLSGESITRVFTQDSEDPPLFTIDITNNSEQEAWKNMGRVPGQIASFVLSSHINDRGKREVNRLRAFFSHAPIDGKPALDLLEKMFSEYSYRVDNNKSGNLGEFQVEVVNYNSEDESLDHAWGE